MWFLEKLNTFQKWQKQQKTTIEKNLKAQPGKLEMRNILRGREGRGWWVEEAKNKIRLNQEWAK